MAANVAKSKLPDLDGEDMISVLEEINTFAETPAFKQLLADLFAQPTLKDRYLFVKNVVINKAEQAKRGIVVPAGMAIQRSYFTDNRPTLFCVVKYLKTGKGKMTFTFDHGSHNGGN